MSSAEGTFSGRTNQVLHLDVSVTNNGANSTASWNLYARRASGTGSFTNSPTGSWAVNIGGNTTGGTFPAYNLQANTTVGIASGAYTVPNGVVLNSSASASGVNLLGNASLSTADAVGPGAPGTPTLAAPLPTTINASYAAPGNGGATITNYRVVYSRTDPTLATNSFVDTGTGSPSATLTGLTPGSTYWVATFAQNALGFGPRSGIASIRVGIGGGIWNGSAEVPIITAKVWNGSAEVDLVVGNIWNGTGETTAI